MRKAFTLVELLIVIAIIGTLVAVAVARFANLAADRDVKVCMANIRTLDSAISVYRVQENAWPPAGSIGVLRTAGYILEVPHCPGGGTYSLGTMTGSTAYDRALCNYTGGSHTLPSQ